MSYKLLLGWFLFYFLASPLLPPGTRGTFLNVTFSILLLFSVFTLRTNPKALALAAACGIIAIFLNSFDLYASSIEAETASLSISLILILGISAALFKQVFYTKEGDANLIFGAICIYFLQAVCWALLYTLVEVASPGSFSIKQEIMDGLRENWGSLGVKVQNFLYFSFVTQTTLGYGDITPITGFAKNLAALQAMAGVFYLATLVSGLMGIVAKAR